MAFEPLKFTKNWEDPEDFPTYEPDEAQVRADLQLLHDETKDGLNRLIAALNSAEAAALLPFAPAEGLTSQTVQAAILEVYGAIQKAASGMIVDGSVTKEKLAAALLERVYGGRIYVSMDTPGAAQTPKTDFPIGQLWLRPAFTVENLALEDWDLIGCEAEQTGSGWTLTADGSLSYLTAAQTLNGVGAAGDRVFVYLTASELDDHLDSLELFLNGEAQDLTGGGGVFETALDESGSLELLVQGQWPYAEEGACVTLEALAVVNAEAAEAALEDCAGLSDWPGLLTALVPFSAVRLPRQVFLQTASGVWEQVGYEVLPASMGGTGQASPRLGALLYGSGGGTMNQLSPGGDGALLQLSGGVPAWKQTAAVAAGAGFLQMTSGSYTGTGVPRTVTLPVAPKLLYLFPTDSGFDYCGTNYTRVAGSGPCDNPMVLADGAIVSQYWPKANASGSYLMDLDHVSLNGTALKFYCNDKYTDRACLGNRTGVTYRWVAVY